MKELNTKKKNKISFLEATVLKRLTMTAIFIFKTQLSSHFQTTIFACACVH